MDEQNRYNFKLPIEWIDRIFTRLEAIYSVKYSDLARTQWQSGLYGCTGDEIRKAIALCHTSLIKDAPNVIEFYSYCKGQAVPKQKQLDPFTIKPNTELGRTYIGLIKDKINGKSPAGSEGDITLSTLNQQILDEQANKQNKSGHWQTD